MGVLGIGIDVVQINRFQTLLNRKPFFIKRLSARILHPHRELPEFQTLVAKGLSQEYTRLIAGSWAAKEALYKTLDYEDQQTFQFNQWYRYYVNRKPFIACEHYCKPEVFLSSHSHDGGLIVSTVLRQHK